MIASTLLAVAFVQQAAPLPGWGPSPLKPIALAQKSDAKLATLSNAQLKYRFSYNKAAVTNGEAWRVCEGTIVSPTKFYLEVARFDVRYDTAKASNANGQEIWIADGKRFGKSRYPDYPTGGSLLARPKGPAKPLNGWFTDFSNVILSGVGQASHPLENLVRDAMRAGFKTTSNYRQFVYQKRPFRNYRIVLEKGTTRYEIVLDAQQYVPTNVFNTIGRDTSGWPEVAWNLRPKKSLDTSMINFKPRPKPVRG